MLNIILALIVVMIISFIFGLKVGIKIGRKIKPKIKRINNKHCKIIEIKSLLGKRDRVIERLNKLN